MELVKNREVAISTLWGSRFNDLVKAGVPVVKVWNGALIYLVPWCIPKGAPNKDLAMYFINFTLRPDLQAKYVACIGYGFSNPKTAELLPKDVLQNLPSDPERLKNEVKLSFEFWVKNEAPLQEKFNAWVLK